MNRRIRVSDSCEGSSQEILLLSHASKTKGFDTIILKHTHFSVLLI